MRALKIAILILCISLSSFKCKNDKGYVCEPLVDSMVIKQIDSIGETFLSKGGVMGLAIAVAKEGKLAYGRGFGYIDSAKTKPATDKSYFLMASVSKLVCATITLKLIEEKALTRTHKLDFEPGTHFNYSNSGFILMAMIIENITNKNFGEVLNRTINEPTGLDIKLIADREFDDRTTSFFEFKDSTLMYQPHWTWIKGDGGLTATVNDLALFPFYWSNGTIVSEESFADMWTPTKLTDGINTGYGIGVRTGKFEGEYCIGHTGGNKTTSAIMKYYPNLKTSIVVMVNTDSSPADAQVIEGFVSLAVLKKPIPNLERIAIDDFDPLPYVGDYSSSPNMYYGEENLSIVAYKDNPHLYKKPTGSETLGQKLYNLGDHSFGYERFPMDRIIFETDTTGEIAAFNTYWNGLRKGGLFKKERR